MPVYDLGDVARLKAVFSRIVAGSKIPTDPTTVTVRVMNPDGNVVVKVYGVDVEVVRDGLGAFHLDQSANVVGDWWHRWVGTGAVETAGEAKFNVRASRFPDP